MNLGIVIAVSKYSVLGNNLPGCEVDGKAISTILKTDNKFDDVLVITEKTKSGEIKPSLIDFISRHKENEINDIVFYFTGHGDFSGDEFYFLLSDYDKKRRKQTSLENTELDNLLRSLNPENTVKIVDACHSGTPYIKDPDAFDTYLKGTQGQFKKCYFMFSSQADQYSYQDSYLSYFTRSIVESVYNYTSSIIRYKDVIDHVSDAFSENSSQTPFFIVQADFIEPFCTISETLKSSLSNYLLGRNAPPTEQSGTKKNVLELVQEEAEEYCTEEEAISLLKSFIDKIKSLPLQGEVKDIYQTVHNDETDYSSVPNASAIGKWLDTNDHALFAESLKEDVVVHKRVRDPFKLISSSSIFGGDDDNYKIVKELVTKIRGFRSTVDLPLTLLRIVAEPNFPNITAAACYIVPIISRTTLQVFFSFDFFADQGWGERSASDSVNWSTETVKLKDENSCEQLSKRIISEFSNFLMAPLVDRYGLDESHDSEDSSDSTDEND